MRVPTPAPLPAPVVAMSRWGVFWLVMILLAGAAGYVNGWGRVDRALSDQIAAFSGRAAPADVLIVAIDERSIAALGRWPWRRAVHAQLLDRLSQAGVRSVGLDLLFTDADTAHPDDDRRLAQALRANGKVVLPLNAQWPDGATPEAALPLPGLLAATRGVGHGHLELDADGVARGVFLQEGTAAQRWPHWVLAQLQAGGEGLDIERIPSARRSADDDGLHALDAGHWQRDHLTLIPYAGPPGHFTRLSYLDVLEGRVDPTQLRDRHVLVGVSAVGLGMAFATPMASADSLMPGIEVAANLLDSLRQGIHLRLATPWENALFCAVPMLLAALLLFRAPPRWAFWWLLLLGVTVVLAAWWLRRAPGIQVAPLAALISLALVPPLWAWFRLDGVVRYLASEFRRLQHDDHLFVTPPSAQRLPSGDTLDRHMQAVADAAAQLRTLQHFVQDSFDSLSDAVIAVNHHGGILFVNQAAQRYFGQPSALLYHQRLPSLLAERLRPADQSPLPNLSEAFRQGELNLHVVDAQCRDLLLKCRPRRSADGTVFGAIVSLVDISSVQQVQRQREEALRFLSHDMRAPQSSILTLLELHRLDPGSEPELLERVEAHARRTLSLADAFVHLARAQSDVFESEVIDLADVVMDAADHYWDQARALDVEILTALPPAPAWCRGDRELLARAVGNLIDNALKYGPRGARVQCRLSSEPGQHVVSVIDQGQGIALEDQAGLFDHFRRFGEPAGPRGVGLGLPLVQAVVTRHRGHIEVDSAPGQGAHFRITLPAAPEPDEAA